MSDPWSDAFWFVSGCTITALVLTEQVEALPAAAVACLAADWIVRTDRRRHLPAARSS
jgi:hypothetical protein